MRARGCSFAQANQGALPLRKGKMFFHLFREMVRDTPAMDEALPSNTKKYGK
jgi:hypothetical protein